jgi:hypothetical protein
MKNILTLVAIALLLSSCKTTETTPPTTTTFAESVKLGKKADRLNQSADNLRDNKDKPAVVVAEAEKVDVVATELRTDDATVKAYQKQIVELQNEIKKVNETYASETNKSRQKMYSIATWIGGILALVGAIGLVASIKIPFVGSLGAGFAFLGILIISSVQFMSTYDWAVIAMGAVAVLGLVGFVAYRIIKVTKKNTETKVANVELIKSGELFKSALNNPTPPSWDNLRKTISQMQSPSTQAIVAHVKKTQINNPV